MITSSRLSLALLTGVLAAAPSTAVAQERVDGQYIVVLKSQSSGATVTKAKERARSRGGKVLHTYSHAIKGYSAKLSKQALAAVKADPNVLYVEQDRTSRSRARRPTRPGVWTASTSAACRSTRPTTTADRAGRERVHHRHRHPHHPQRLRRARDVAASTRSTAARPTTATATARTSPARSAARPTASPSRSRWSPCACSTAAAAGTYAGVIAGVDWVTENHQAGQPAVANMSLGGGASQAVDDAVTRSIADGVSYAIAAGNAQRRRVRLLAGAHAERDHGRRDDQHRRARLVLELSARASTSSRRARTSRRRGSAPTRPRTRSAARRWRRRTSPARPRSTCRPTRRRRRRRSRAT